jgi:hypothetical protein
MLESSSISLLPGLQEKLLHDSPAVVRLDQRLVAGGLAFLNPWVVRRCQQPHDAGLACQPIFVDQLLPLLKQAFR